MLLGVLVFLKKTKISDTIVILFCNLYPSLHKDEKKAVRKSEYLQEKIVVGEWHALSVLVQFLYKNQLIRRKAPEKEKRK